MSIVVEMTSREHPVDTRETAVMAHVKTTPATMLQATRCLPALLPKRRLVRRAVLSFERLKVTIMAISFPNRD